MEFKLFVIIFVNFYARLASVLMQHMVSCDGQTELVVQAEISAVSNAVADMMLIQQEHQCIPSRDEQLVLVTRAGLSSVAQHLQLTAAMPQQFYGIELDGGCASLHQTADALPRATFTVTSRSRQSHRTTSAAA